MQKKIFITGTDTEVGKTFFTTAFIRALQKAEHAVVAFKPVAAGCVLVNGEWQNDDAQQIQSALNAKLSYEQVNPIALQAAIAPHIAAQQESVKLSVAEIQSKCNLSHHKQEIILVEGAGGWLVPLNDTETFADYVNAESLDVILVVGLKLGCINHALLSQQAIKAKGLNLIGWVANHIDPNMLEQSENINTLAKMLDCPLIAKIPFLKQESNQPVLNLSESASEYVRIQQVIK